MHLSIDRVATCDANWAELDRHARPTPFQTKAWLAYVATYRGAEPVLARVEDRGRAIGFFTGAIVSYAGLRILGSPLKGWATPYMGFILEPGVPRKPLIEPLRQFAFRELGCHHVELVDRELTELEPPEAECTVRTFDTMQIDLSRSSDDLFSRMDGACRQCIRKADRHGVTVAEALPDGFAEEHYAQLVDVFDRKGMAPPFGVERIKILIRSVHPTGQLLLLRAYGPDGASLATGIFPGSNDVAYLWGSASWRHGHPLRPNEALIWHAIRHWQSRGTGTFDMGGMGKYKLKYGSRHVSYPYLLMSRSRIVAHLRDLAEKAWQMRWDLRAGLQRRPQLRAAPDGPAPGASSS